VKTGRGFVVVPVRRGPCRKCGAATRIALIVPIDTQGETLTMRVCGVDLEDFVENFGTRPGQDQRLSPVLQEAP
jgi:hypothetical protein